MTTCKNCGSPMVEMIFTSFCKAECDLKVTVPERRIWSVGADLDIRPWAEPNANGDSFDRRSAFIKEWNAAWRHTNMPSFMIGDPNSLMGSLVRVVADRQLEAERAQEWLLDRMSIKYRDPRER